MIPVCYQNERLVEGDSGLTLLQLSHRHGIPHASACGGQARCSTCRVLVVEHADHLSAPTPAETLLAGRKGFGDCVRLACQVRPLGPVTVRRLVLDDEDLEMAQGDGPRALGAERTLAILFSDLREFTPFAESHLAYDVAHVLNRYFRRMGESVLRHGGYIDKYIGDGLMALFGLESDDCDAACRSAVACALEMLAALPGLNTYLARQFGQALRMGIGVHVGAVIVADLGHPSKRQLTAIGQAVNMASRIESATKEVGVGLLVSADVLSRLGPAVSVGKRQTVALKGIQEPSLLTEVRARCRTRNMDIDGGNVPREVLANKMEDIMIRNLYLLAAGFALGAGSIAATQHHEDGESVKVITTHDIKEKLDGKDAKVTVVEVTIGPGQAGLPHRHPGPGFVYVLEGEYELGIDDQPTKLFKAGETFYESTGRLHRVSRNPAAKGRTRLIAFVLHPRDAKEIAIPEHKQK